MPLGEHVPTFLPPNQEFNTRKMESALISGKQLIAGERYKRLPKTSVRLSRENADRTAGTVQTEASPNDHGTDTPAGTLDVCG